MRKIDIKKRKDTDVTDEALYALEIDSHRIWQEQGLRQKNDPLRTRRTQKKKHLEPEMLCTLR